MIKHDMMVKKTYLCKNVTAVNNSGKVTFDLMAQNGDINRLVLEGTERLLFTEELGMTEDLKVQVYELIRREDAK